MSGLTQRIASEESGSAYAAVEMVLVLAIIVLPLLSGIAQIPRWVDARSTADLAAQEAVRAMVLADTWDEGWIAAERVVATIADNRGLDVGDIEDVSIVGDLNRGGTVTVTVTLQVPPIVLPGVGPIGGEISLSRSASERVDDFREFG